MMIFASDYDGTFHVSEEQTWRNVEAVRRWRAAGNQFGLVTGRSIEMAMEPVRQYSIPVDFLICTNGASIFRADGALLSGSPMEGEHLAQLLESDPIQGSLRFFVLSSQGTFVDSRVSDEWRPNGVRMPEKISVAGAARLESVWQISVACRGEAEAKACADQVNRRFAGIYQAYDNIDSVDIVTAGMNKSEGIRWYRSHCGQDARRVLVIGDGGNDVEMLRAFQGYTVSTACEAAKAAAAQIFESVEKLMETTLQTPPPGV